MKFPGSVEGLLVFFLFPLANFNNEFNAGCFCCSFGTAAGWAGTRGAQQANRHVTSADTGAEERVEKPDWTLGAHLQVSGWSFTLSAQWHVHLTLSWHSQVHRRSWCVHLHQHMFCWQNRNCISFDVSRGFNSRKWFQAFLPRWSLWCDISVRSCLKIVNSHLSVDETCLNDKNVAKLLNCFPL